MVRNCPAQLEFGCPTEDSIMDSYSVYVSNTPYDTCNIVSEAYFRLTWENAFSDGARKKGQKERRFNLVNSIKFNNSLGKIRMIF